MTWWQIILLVLFILVVIGALLIAAFYIYEAITKESGPKVGDNTVEARGFQFVPSTITVKKGTKVCWKNLNSSLLHNVVQIDSDSCSANPVQGGFTSENPGQVDEYCHMFDTVGTFYYKCVPHCLPFLFSMKGSVVVTE